MQHKGGVGRHRVGVSEVVGFLGHRLCLVHVKVFLENILFFGNAIFRKGKRFHVFGCHKIRFTEN